LETSSPSTGLQEAHVKKGDTLEKIARAHHTTVDEIIKLNHLPSSFLRVGQVLKLPAEKTLSAKTAKSAMPEKLKQDTGPDYYTVKVGDNPWMIAIKHHLKLEELLKLNGLNEEKARKLKPGDRLRIK
jgi:LysM repeat protein